jgi:hypothetical protein
MVYGWCLPRIIHYVVSLRGQNLRVLILISKFDYRQRYVQTHRTQSQGRNPDHCDQRFHRVLAFPAQVRGFPKSPTWCVFLELVTGLSNKISQCAEWDPLSSYGVQGNRSRRPHARTAATVPESPDRSGPSHLTHNPPDKGGGRVDGFIDDLIDVFLYTPELSEATPRRPASNAPYQSPARERLGGAHTPASHPLNSKARSGDSSGGRPDGSRIATKHTPPRGINQKTSSEPGQTT